MRKGFTVIQLLLALAAIAIVATAVVYTTQRLKPVPATTGNTNVVANTNAATDVNAEANTNVSANVNAAVSATQDWKTYTNATNGFSFQYPPEWYISSEQATSWILTNWDTKTAIGRGGLESGMIKADFSFRAARSTDPQCSVGEGETLVSCSDVVINGVTYKKEVVDSIVEGGGRFVSLKTVRNERLFNVNGLQAAADGLAKLDQIFSTFRFTAQTAATNTNSNAIVGQADSVTKSKLPIKDVQNISSLFSGWTTNGINAVSVMGSRALVGGTNNKLFLYEDGGSVTDLSDKITTVRPEHKYVASIANNGQYWLLSTALSGEGNRLYRFDGVTWTDLTEQYQKGQGRENSIDGMAWNGQYWLIGDRDGETVRYDGNTFTDITNLRPSRDADHDFVNDIDWNGEYFLLALRAKNNTAKLYRYDGKTFTEITNIPSTSQPIKASWDGSRWLLAGTGAQNLLLLDGETFTDTGLITAPFNDPVWIAPVWFLGEEFFDGEKLVDADELFPLLSRVSSISLGTDFGLAADMDGTIYRFTWK